ncbi:hypothetical protein L596_023885 [Steinernema carpocapsae]|uniref:Uncharacterized protein n=1 Tax=Steinernema carpocapsae TaxID=34508 RepID=A0A4U5MF04_STECR|nr:hypothetical protein L596_023885 [Steinernema carpocapsae]
MPFGTGSGKPIPSFSDATRLAKANSRPLPEHLRAPVRPSSDLSTSIYREQAERYRAEQYPGSSSSDETYDQSQGSSTSNRRRVRKEMPTMSRRQPQQRSRMAQEEEPYDPEAEKRANHRGILAYQDTGTLHFYRMQETGDSGRMPYCLIIDKSDHYMVAISPKGQGLILINRETNVENFDQFKRGDWISLMIHKTCPDFYEGARKLKLPTLPRFPRVGSEMRHINGVDEKVTVEFDDENKTVKVFVKKRVALEILSAEMILHDETKWRLFAKPFGYIYFENFEHMKVLEGIKVGISSVWLNMDQPQHPMWYPTPETADEVRRYLKATILEQRLKREQEMEQRRIEEEKRRAEEERWRIAEERKRAEAARQEEERRRREAEECRLRNLKLHMERAAAAREEEQKLLQEKKVQQERERRKEAERVAREEQERLEQERIRKEEGRTRKEQEKEEQNRPIEIGGVEIQQRPYSSDSDPEDQFSTFDGYSRDDGSEKEPEEPEPTSQPEPEAGEINGSPWKDEGAEEQKPTKRTVNKWGGSDSDDVEDNSPPAPAPVRSQPVPKEGTRTSPRTVKPKVQPRNPTVNFQQLKPSSKPKVNEWDSDSDSDNEELYPAENTAANTPFSSTPSRDYRSMNSRLNFSSQKTSGYSNQQQPRFNSNPVASKQSHYQNHSNYQNLQRVREDSYRQLHPQNSSHRDGASVHTSNEYQRPAASGNSQKTARPPPVNPQAGSSTSRNIEELVAPKLLDRTPNSLRFRVPPRNYPVDIVLSMEPAKTISIEPVQSADDLLGSVPQFERKSDSLIDIESPLEVLQPVRRETFCSRCQGKSEYAVPADLLGLDIGVSSGSSSMVNSVSQAPIYPPISLSTKPLKPEKKLKKLCSKKPVETTSELLHRLGVDAGIIEKRPESKSCEKSQAMEVTQQPEAVSFIDFSKDAAPPFQNERKQSFYADDMDPFSTGTSSDASADSPDLKKEEVEQFVDCRSVVSPLDSKPNVFAEPISASEEMIYFSDDAPEKLDSAEKNGESSEDLGNGIFGDEKEEEEREPEEPILEYDDVIVFYRTLQKLQKDPYFARDAKLMKKLKSTFDDLEEIKRRSYQY